MVITEYETPLPVKQKIRAVVAADLHSSPAAASIAEMIAECRPDIILIPGDLCHVPDKTEPAVEFLKKCADIAPIFYSFGNHERTASESDFAVKGVRILNNRAVRFRDLYIGGLRSGFIGQRESAIAATPDPCFAFLDEFEMLPGAKLLLSHHPEYYPLYLRDRNVGVVVSGHAHGGQWRFFGRGLFAPGQGLFPKYTSGICDGRLVISRGLSNTVRIPRFFNPTELVVLNIVPSDGVEQI